MADDITYTSTNPAGPPASTRQVTDEHASRGHMPVVKLAHSADGDATLVGADANGLDVDVTRLPSLPAGSSNIGDVDIASLPNEGQQNMAGSISVAIASDQSAIPISAASLPLPSGASTAANQSTLIGHVDTLESGLAAILGELGQKTEPADTQPVSAASLPLPTGAATLAEQQTQSASLSTLDDWDESDRAKVNPIAGQAGVQGGSGTVSANTQRVVLATDISLPTGSNAIGKLAANSGVDIGDVDVLTLPGTFAEDAVHNSGETGMLVLGVRRDADTTPVSGDGDYHALQFDDAGNLKVNIKAGAGSGGTALADGAIFTPDTSSLTPIGGYRDDTAPATVTEGDAAACRITTNRALHVNLRDASGNELSVGGGTQYDEDTASSAADKLTMAGVVRKDTATTLVDTDGDRTQLQVDANGRLHINGSGVTQPVSHAALTELAAAIDTEVQVDVVGSLPAGDNNIGGVDVVSSALPTGASTLAEQQAQTTALQLLDDTVATDGSATPTKGILIAGQDGTNAQTIKTDSNGELQVDVLSLPTPAAVADIPFSVTATVSADALPSQACHSVLIQGRKFDDSGVVQEGFIWIEIGGTKCFELEPGSDPISINTTNANLISVRSNAGSIVVSGVIRP